MNADARQSNCHRLPTHLRSFASIRGLRFSSAFRSPLCLFLQPPVSSLQPATKKSPPPERTPAAGCWDTWKHTLQALLIPRTTSTLSHLLAHFQAKVFAICVRAFGCCLLSNVWSGIEDRQMTKMPDENPAASPRRARLAAPSNLCHDKSAAVRFASRVCAWPAICHPHLEPRQKETHPPKFVWDDARSLARGKL